MMQRLKRDWRKSLHNRGDDDVDNFSLPTRDDFQPIDSNEQEELVRSFERSQAQQSLVWRCFFSLMLFGYVLFTCYSIYQQANFPWQMNYHAYFMYELDSWSIIIAGGFSYFIYQKYFVIGIAMAFLACSLIIVPIVTHVTDCVAVSVCLITIFGLLHDSKSHKRYLWYSCFLGLLLAFFWLYHMMRLSKFRWDIVWLPVGPVSVASVCIYVDHLLDESSEEVRKLRGYMYSYKAR